VLRNFIQVHFCTFITLLPPRLHPFYVLLLSSAHTDPFQICPALPCMTGYTLHLHHASTAWRSCGPIFSGFNYGGVSCVFSYCFAPASFIPFRALSPLRICSSPCHPPRFVLCNHSDANARPDIHSAFLTPRHSWEVRPTQVCTLFIRCQSAD
jgi:hypothetical protein